MTLPRTTLAAGGGVVAGFALGAALVLLVMAAPPLEPAIGQVAIVSMRVSERVWCHDEWGTISRVEFEAVGTGPGRALNVSVEFMAWTGGVNDEGLWSFHTVTRTIESSSHADVPKGGGIYTNATVSLRPGCDSVPGSQEQWNVQLRLQPENGKLASRTITWSCTWDERARTCT